MEKILVMTQLPPFEQPDAGTVLLKPECSMTDFSGLLQENSVVRAVMTGKVQIDTSPLAWSLTPDKVDMMNHEYDKVVIPFLPLSVSFSRLWFKILTRFIKMLKIPCVVMDTGVLPGFSGDNRKEVKAFIKAVLNRSAVMGVCGEKTGECLKALGFREDKEYRVIGNPAMYWYGDRLPELKQIHLTEDCNVCINWGPSQSREVNDFMVKNAFMFKQSYYMPLDTDEIRLMYYGIPLPENKVSGLLQEYPADLTHPWYREGRAAAYTDVNAWMRHLRTMEFSFGPQISGNIAAILSGVPAIVTPGDSCSVEQARYHQIPYVDDKQFGSGETILSLYEKADYSRMYKGHKECFDRYRTFLSENGLEHASDDTGSCVYDKEMEGKGQISPWNSFFSVSVREQAERIAESQKMYQKLKQQSGEMRTAKIVKKIYNREIGVKTVIEKIRGR